MPDELIEEAGKEAAKTAAEGAELANSAGFDATSAVGEEDRAWSAILAAAKKADAGIIVMGSHGRGTVAGRPGERRDRGCTPCESPRDDLPSLRRRLALTKNQRGALVPRACTELGAPTAREADMSQNGPKSRRLSTH